MTTGRINQVTFVSRGAGGSELPRAAHGLLPLGVGGPRSKTNVRVTGRLAKPLEQLTPTERQRLAPRPVAGNSGWVDKHTVDGGHGHSTLCSHAKRCNPHSHGTAGHKRGQNRDNRPGKRSVSRPSSSYCRAGRAMPQPGRRPAHSTPTRRSAVQRL